MEEKGYTTSKIIPKWKTKMLSPFLYYTPKQNAVQQFAYIIQSIYINAAVFKDLWDNIIK